MNNGAIAGCGRITVFTARHDERIVRAMDGAGPPEHPYVRAVGSRSEFVWGARGQRVEERRNVLLADTNGLLECLTAPASSFAFIAFL